MWCIKQWNIYSIKCNTPNYSCLTTMQVDNIRLDFIRDFFYLFYCRQLFCWFNFSAKVFYFYKFNSFVKIISIIFRCLFPYRVCDIHIVCIDQSICQIHYIGKNTTTHSFNHV